MLLVPVHELEEGDLLGKGLYAPDDRLMLKQGMRLNDRLIEGIRRLGQHYVFVESTEFRAHRYRRDWKKNLKAVTKDLLDRCVRSVRCQEPFPAGPLYEWADQLADAIPEKSNLSIQAEDLAHDHETFISHSLNVSILSVSIAKKLGYRDSDISALAIGSLLHDIGLAVPLDDKLIMHHPLIGYDLLRKIPFRMKDLSSPCRKLIHHTNTEWFGLSSASTNRIRSVPPLR